MIKAIFFDFDLTLVDTRKGAKATYKALSKMADKKPTKKGFQKYLGMRFSEMIDEFHEDSGVPRKKLIKRYKEEFISKIPKMKFYGKKIFPEIVDEYEVIILTNNNKEVVKRACDHFDIGYDYLIADKDMKRGEKKHDAIKKSLDKKSLKKSEAIYVGDHINDIREAHKAGIRSVVVPTGVFDKLYIMRQHPDFMIKELSDVRQLLR